MKTPKHTDPRDKLATLERSLIVAERERDATARRYAASGSEADFKALTDAETTVARTLQQRDAAKRAVVERERQDRAAADRADIERARKLLADVEANLLPARAATRKAVHDSILALGEALRADELAHAQLIAVSLDYCRSVRYPRPHDFQPALEGSSSEGGLVKALGATGVDRLAGVTVNAPGIAFAPRPIDEAIAKDGDYLLRNLQRLLQAAEEKEAGQAPPAAPPQHPWHGSLKGSDPNSAQVILPREDHEQLARARRRAASGAS